MTDVIPPYFFRNDMDNKLINVNFAGVSLTYSLVNLETERPFLNYIIPSSASDFSLGMTTEEIHAAKEIYPDNPSDAYVEYMELCPRTSDVLLSCKRCIFHGTAFIWRNKAYIFTAPSGTGKSTQYFLWKILFGDEIRIINGDKPLLEFREDNTIWVHPSPWLGKEGMGRMESAQLGGIIYLLQGKKNKIRSLPITEAILPLFYQFMFSCKDAQQVQSVCQLEELLLKNIPVWELTNLGDEASARLCHDTILKQEENL